MPVQKTWRVRCIATRGGGDLVLAGLAAVTAQSLPIESLTASHAPIDGSVSDLIGAAGSCRFAAADVNTSGFYLEVTLVTEAELWGVRFLSGDIQGQPVTYLLEAQNAAKDAAMLGALTYTPWSQQPSSAPSFFQAPGWRKEVTQEASNLLYIFASGDGRVRFISTSTPEAYVSKNYGQSYSYIGTYRIDRAWVSEDGNLAYLSSATSGVYRYVNGFLTQISGSSSWGTCDPAAALAGTKVLLASNAALRLSTDSGATWSTLTVAGFTSGFSSCAMSEDGQVLVVTRSNNWAYLSKDGGASWSGIPGSYTGASLGKPGVSSDGNTILIRGDTVLPLVSSNRGTSWFSITAIAPTSTGIGSALSADGKSAILVDTYSIAVYGIDTGKTRYIPHPWSGSTHSFVGANLCANGALVLLRVMVRSTSVSTFQSNWLTDAVYAIPSGIPSRCGGTEMLSLGEQIPFTIDPAGAPEYTDEEDGGTGVIYGTTELAQSPTNLKVSRRVRLHNSRDGRLVRECWSDADGNYRFEGLSTQQEYDAIAHDHTRLQRSAIANNLPAEVRL